ncbi:MAG: phosphate acyltransferase PlsX [Peptoniphilaceae bacterium]|nr:phosphate acyltransferase PlsX [Peptoniphilaceae bacterium]
MTKIIVDAMGADAGVEMVADALTKARRTRDFEAVIVGPEDALVTRFREDPKVEILNTTEYISNDEAPAFAIRRKKEASIVKGLRLLNESGDVLVTAGSTGALLAGGYLITKRIAGMERLCLAAMVPRGDGGVLMADAGATMDTSPEVLLQFGELLSNYAEAALKKVNPRVGLLNIGAESEKGDKRAVKTHELLRESSLNFVGNVEARDILTAPVDVIITDGFAGNIALKTLEGTARYFRSIVKQVLTTSARTKLGALLIQSELKNALQPLDYRAHGGAPLLGARKALYKAHGNSNAETFALAIHEALDFAESGVVERLSALSETSKEQA